MEPQPPVVIRQAAGAGQQVIRIVLAVALGLLLGGLLGILTVALVPASGLLPIPVFMVGMGWLANAALSRDADGELHFSDEGLVLRSRARTATWNWDELESLRVRASDVAAGAVPIQMRFSSGALDLPDDWPRDAIVAELERRAVPRLADGIARRLDEGQEIPVPHPGFHLAPLVVGVLMPALGTWLVMKQLFPRGALGAAVGVLVVQTPAYLRSTRGGMVLTRSGLRRAGEPPEKERAWTAVVGAEESAAGLELRFSEGPPLVLGAWSWDYLALRRVLQHRIR